MKKYILGAVLSLGILASPAFTQAAALTNEQVQSILSLLSAFGADSGTVLQVKAVLTGTPSTTTTEKWCHTFGTNLGIGSQGNEIRALFTALGKENLYVGDVVDSFDEGVASRIVEFQKRYGILQTGYVGPLTRAKLNLLYGCGGRTVTPIPSPTITVLSPNGGEGYLVGQEMPISFSTNLTDVQTPGVTLQLYRGLPGSSGASFVQTIASNWVGGSPYRWQIPLTISADQYSIYASAPVRATALPEGGVSDASNATFTIGVAMRAPTISYITPSAAIVGSTVYVYGSNFNSGTYIAIDGEYGQTIAPTLLSATSLSFVVPASVSIGTHTVQVGEKASDFPASGSVQLHVVITAPSFSVASPAATLYAGSTYTITWSSTNYPSTGKVSVKLLQGSSGTPPTETPYLSVIVPNSGSYNWTIPTGVIQAPNYYISVTCDDAGLRSYGSCSNGISRAFGIVPGAVTPPTITAVTPTSGTVGTTVSVYGSNLSEVTSVEFYSENQLAFSLVPSATLPEKITFPLDKIVTANVKAGTYEIAVVTKACPGGCASNRLKFTLLPTEPAYFIRLTSPVPGQTWTTGIRYPVQWNANLPIGATVNIDLVSASGQTTPLAHGAEAFPTVILPNDIASGTYSIQVSATINGQLVSGKGDIKVSAPAQDADITANALNAFSSARDALAATPIPDPQSDIYVWNRDLQIGSPYTDDIAALQKALIIEGVYSGDTTGGFYSGTYQAVKLFQQKYGIEPTGYVGSQTRAKLNALY